MKNIWIMFGMDMVLLPFKLFGTLLLHPVFCFTKMKTISLDEYWNRLKKWCCDVLQLFSITDAFLLLLHVTRCHECLLNHLCFTWFFVLSFSLLMHSDILVFTPQQHTIHVVVSCSFHNLGSLFFTVALSFRRLCFCLICNWATSQITWMSPWVKETGSI